MAGGEVSSGRTFLDELHLNFLLHFNCVFARARDVLGGHGLQVSVLFLDMWTQRIELP